MGLRVFAVVLVVVMLVPPLRAEPDARPWLEAPLRFHVARQQGAPVADAAFVARQLAAANRVFAPHRVRFRSVGSTPLEGRAVLVSRQHRDDLAAHVRPGAIDVFVMAMLMDVDEPGRKRCGVHWHPRHAPERRLVIVRVGCMDDVLAHELGHYLGLRRHSDIPGNLMSYERGDFPVATLEPRQVDRLRDVLAGLLARGDLAPP